MGISYACPICIAFQRGLFRASQNISRYATIGVRAQSTGNRKVLTIPAGLMYPHGKIDQGWDFNETLNAIRGVGVIIEATWSSPSV